MRRRPHLTASPVHNSPLEGDGSDADEIGISALSVRKSGTPPSTKIAPARTSPAWRDHHLLCRLPKATVKITKKHGGPPAHGAIGWGASHRAELFMTPTIH